MNIPLWASIGLCAVLLDILLHGNAKVSDYLHSAWYALARLKMPEVIALASKTLAKGADKLFGTKVISVRSLLMAVLMTLIVAASVSLLTASHLPWTLKERGRNILGAIILIGAPCVVSILLTR